MDTEKQNAQQPQKNTQKASAKTDKLALVEKEHAKNQANG